MPYSLSWLGSNAIACIKCSVVPGRDVEQSVDTKISTVKYQHKNTFHLRLLADCRLKPRSTDRSS